MEVLRYDDPAMFRRDGAPVLLASPARNSTLLALLHVLEDSPEVYPTFRLWMAAGNGRPVGLAMQTDPFGVLLAEPLEGKAVDALAEAVVADAGPLPGIIGNLPWADRFAECLTTLTGRKAKRILNEGVWELTSVMDVSKPSGDARVAIPGDRDLLRRWIRAFEDETLSREHERRDDAATDLVIDLRLAGRGSGYWLWEDGTPVSVSGHRDIPGVGSHIGPIYTPSQHRGRGYATRLVAELSAARFAIGDPACFLLTDTANRTSTSIYARIGYVKICDSAEYAFSRDP